MPIPKLHISAKSSHYDEDAQKYDALNEERSLEINQIIGVILKKNNAKSVLDLTCGTGSQVFWLAKHGYEVVGSDINAKMLDVARKKAQEKQIDIKFIEGDMRSQQVGKFDAVITIFNAVGHLTKTDFEKGMQNICNNLKVGGIYVFDIFNLAYLLHQDNISGLTIDWYETKGSKKIRKIQYSTIDNLGVLTSYTTYITQQEQGDLNIAKEEQTLQVYSLNQLEEMLHRNGFEVAGFCGADGSKFVETQSERILMTAKKRA